MNYKKKATITLIAVSISFAILSLMKIYFHKVFIIDMIFYVLEAALIGGMADWFAVTAIFRKPLGFPFHTAIIPNNRKTIVDSVVKIVENEFLSEEILSERLSKVRVTEKLVRFIDSDKGRGLIKAFIENYINTGLNEEKIDKIRLKLTELSKSGLQKIDLGVYINKGITWSITSDEYKKLFNFLLNNAIILAEKPELKEKIFILLENFKDEKTQGLFGGLVNSFLEGSNVVNLEELAAAIHIQLLETLYNLKDEENIESKHVLEALKEHLMINAKNPLDDSKLNDLIDFVVDEIITNDNIFRVINNIIISKNDSDKNNELMHMDDGIKLDLSNNIINIINKALSTRTISDSIEVFIKQLLSNVIIKEHSMIGNIVRDTLDAFSDEALNDFIESRAGNDLQWIRINGSIVGGMVGLIVFLFLRVFYDPIAVPFIKNLFS